MFDKEELIKIIRKNVVCPEFGKCPTCEYHRDDLFGGCDASALIADVLIEHGLVEVMSDEHK